MTAPDAAVPVNGGAVTFISAADLAAVQAAGGSTIGQPVVVADGDGER